MLFDGKDAAQRVLLLDLSWMLSISIGSLSISIWIEQSFVLSLSLFLLPSRAEPTWQERLGAFK